MSKEVDKMLADSTKEMEQAKRVLQELANEVAALAEIVKPALDRQIAAIRSARMTSVTEITGFLNSAREIRKFFIEATYEVEMARFREYVELCERLKALKADGTLDAVADVVIRLATKETLL